MLKKTKLLLGYLTQWTVSLARRKSAGYWLALIAFVESSVFLIPADVLFVPMALVKPKKAWHYATIATIFSVLGGIAGWLIGLYAYEAVARPVLEFYGKLVTFENLRASASLELIILLLITSGLCHLPPIKVVTILSGVLAVNFWLFVFLAIMARGFRFYLMAWIIQRHGATLLDFVLKRLTWIVAIAAFLLIVGAIFYKVVA